MHFPPLSDVSSGTPPQAMLLVGGFAGGPIESRESPDGDVPEGLALYHWRDGHAVLAHVLNLDQPTWFVWSDRHRMLYVSHSARTWLSAVSIPAGPESAELVDTIDIGCLNPAHISLDPEQRAVIAACFTGGEVVGIALDERGRFAGVRSRTAIAGLAPNALRRHVFQSDAEPHQSVFVAEGSRCLVSDRAQDAVHAFHYRGDGDMEYDTSYALRPGSGPRHLVAHPTEALAYVAGELDSTVITVRLGSEGIEPVRAQSSIPETFFGENAVAAIDVSPDGGRLIVSNRGHESVALFDIAADPEHPALLGWIPVRGHTPRYSGFLPEISAFAIAAMGSNGVQIFPADVASLDRAAAGMAGPLHLRHTAPACVRAVVFA